MRTRLPLAAGVAAPPVFVAVLLIEGVTRPGYNSWRDMGSSLSTGPGGWIQIVNFIACGLLIMVPAIALARSHGAICSRCRCQCGSVTTAAMVPAASAGPVRMVALAASMAGRRGIAVRVVRIMPVLYSLLMASKARMAMTAWPTWTSVR
ncbi:MAG TPA: DUF998 domain-containing protein [Streptosporangiaceae bacterium]|nr:DUF998 domain-containing protein [Streptosporangiaceae bacterium]